MATTPLRDPFGASVPSFSIIPMTCSSATVLEGAALVIGGSDNVCALPSAGEVGGFIGFALLGGAAGANQVINVCVGPTYLAIGSGTITRGDKLVIASSTGDVKTATNRTADAASIVGVALESATDGQRVRVRIANSADFVSSPQALVKSFTAGTGGSTAGCAVVQDTIAGQCILPSGADPASGVLGIALNTAIAAATVYVVIYGVTLGKAAAAGFTVGDNLAISGSTGVLKLAAPATGANTMLVGTALETATNGQLRNVLVRPCLMQGA